MTHIMQMPCAIRTYMKSRNILYFRLKTRKILRQNDNEQTVQRTQSQRPKNKMFLINIHVVMDVIIDFF